MWVQYNPNPFNKNVGDCVVRAISKALELDWESAYAGLTTMGFALGDMPSANHVWGAYLRRNGFKKHLVEDKGVDNYTVGDFCNDNPKGVYVLALSGHVVCVKDGDLFDSWNSLDEIPLYVWSK